MAYSFGMEIKKVEAQNKVHINGDRNEPLISALIDIKIHKPELWKELSKVIQFNLSDGYPLSVYEPREET